ncbi:hypothetical protein RRG08_014943 [Elysia crispata]|uniref:Uncharacterized protein n=1 Tax=Elysia crispata TaxID=231223 RepID=A0AAE1BCN8_9GAST|nr:hypothetical protein RRG08_014943 [Elysia crispata]
MLVHEKKKYDIAVKEVKTIDHAHVRSGLQSWLFVPPAMCGDHKIWLFVPLCAAIIRAGCLYRQLCAAVMKSGCLYRQLCAAVMKSGCLYRYALRSSELVLCTAMRRGHEIWLFVPLCAAVMKAGCLYRQLCAAVMKSGCLYRYALRSSELVLCTAMYSCKYLASP